MPLVLAALAQAHPTSSPHAHPTDPASVAIVAIWLIAGVVFLAALPYASGRSTARAS